MAAPCWRVVRADAWGDGIFGQPTALTIHRPKTVPGYGCLKRYTGVCQIVGGANAPLLANVYLHYVLDVCWEEVVKPRLAGRAFLIRYADDFVIGFTDEADARRVREVLPKRFGKYGRSLHTDKKRLVPLARLQEQTGWGEPEAGNQHGTF